MDIFKAMEARHSVRRYLSRPLEGDLARALEQEVPDGFRRGMEAALLAPTAVDQQKFLITLRGDRVSARTTGFCSQIDLGIVKYHFELGAGKKNFRWEE